MTRRTTSVPELKSAQLNFAQLESAISRLKKRIEAVRRFDVNAIRVYSDARALVSPLEASIDDALVQSFGLDTIEYKRYNSANKIYYPSSFYEDPPVSDVRRSVGEEQKRIIALLEGAVLALEERLSEFSAPSSGDLKRSLPVLGNKNPNSINENKKIFVVHGHDSGARETVSSFLSALGFEPIVLHRQVNQGRTIIEKFEDTSDVGFAVVLLTPDDVGGRSADELVPRARQNVILELGYFIGRLGRSRVAALKGHGVEVPSDILGIVWTPLDEHEAWKIPLARELKSVGYSVDLNLAL